MVVLGVVVVVSGGCVCGWCGGSIESCRVGCCLAVGLCVQVVWWCGGVVGSSEVLMVDDCLMVVVCSAH